MRIYKYTNTTDEELLNMLKQYYIENNKVPTSIIMHNENTGLPDIRVYSKRFGSWAKALRFAGFENITNSYTFEEKNENLMKFLKDKKDGKLSYKSDKKVWTICPICRYEGKKEIRSLTNFGYKCDSCSDNKSKSEKIMSSILKQLDIHFEKEKCFDWSDRKRYDFYIPSLSCIIETNGIQHYNYSGFYQMGGRTLQEEQDNDKYKEKLAKENGIKFYVQLDCRDTNPNSLILSIINNTYLLNILDLDKIDYNKTYEDCMSNYRHEVIKKTCELYNKNLTTTKISELLGLSIQMVIKYLKDGSNLGLCNYDKKQFWIKRKENEIVGCKSKKVYCEETNKIYLSSKLAFEDIKKLSDDKFVYSNFCGKCRIASDHLYKGFHIYYIEERMD